ncbi:hypothetical protein C4578_03390 [Candidatus Microgenomates bacterium]|jgi:hypothetical protein|nr:MAG: hypothetical protein C4578_03390 [Candidatus Microgenomates bacterium]
MYLLVTDETNAEPTTEGEFFIFGGIIFEDKNLLFLDEEIRKIREGAGYKKSDLFKFDTRLRPTYVSKEKFNEAKDRVLDICVKNGVNFIAYLIHHGIVDKTLKIESAINHLTSGFNKFLNEKDAFGACFYDRMPKIENQFNLLRDNFSNGLRFPNGKRIKLEKIKLHGITCSGASNIYSATDIVLGSFRYCVNKPRSEKLASYMIKKISDMVWGDREGRSIRCVGKGIILRPQKPGIKYKKDYSGLIENINSLLRRE